MILQCSPWAGPRASLQFPELAGAVSAALGRFSEKGMARIPSRSVLRLEEISTKKKKEREREKTSPARTLEVTTAKIQKLAAAECASSFSCTDWRFKFLKGVLEDENGVFNEALVLDWTWISGFRLLLGFRGLTCFLLQDSLKFWDEEARTRFPRWLRLPPKKITF